MKIAVNPGYESFVLKLEKFLRHRQGGVHRRDRGGRNGQADGLLRQVRRARWREGVPGGEAKGVGPAGQPRQPGLKSGPDYGYFRQLTSTVTRFYFALFI